MTPGVMQTKATFSPKVLVSENGAFYQLLVQIPLH